MLLGRVAGTLVASRKDKGLQGQKFLVVREIGTDGKEIHSQDFKIGHRFRRALFPHLISAFGTLRRYLFLRRQLQNK